MERYSNEQLMTYDRRTLDRILNETRHYKAKRSSAVETKRKMLEANTDAIFTGNVEDINSLLWPYFFSTPMILLKANDAKTTNISVTMEAPFSIKRFSRTVFEIIDMGLPTEHLKYIRPQVAHTANSNIHDITYQLVDSVSSRDWSEQPISLDYMGDGKEPLEYDQPYMLEPNTNLQIRLNNVSETKNYYVGMTVYGNRIRVEDMQRVAGQILI